MDFCLKELDKKEILSVYKRFVRKFFTEADEDNDFVISEAAVRWLLARGIYRGYGLYDAGKHLLCFGLFISDISGRVFLLNYFSVLKKYRGYNYPEIFFELLKGFLQENRVDGEEAKPLLPLGIFLELRGVDSTKLSEPTREKELMFYNRLGAYMTDIIPAISDTEYNVLFMPVNARPSRADLLVELMNIYKEILPSFKDRKKYIKRLTEEVDGLI